jgi:hypothetical protein
MLKEAQWVEPFELLDRDFALIIVDEEGKEHRKFACHDPGNIAMSMWYLENVDSGLPEHAQVVAAYNLTKAACLDVEPPKFSDEERRFVIDERRVLVKEAMMMSGMGMSPGAMGATTGKGITGSLNPMSKMPSRISPMSSSASAATSLPVNAAQSTPKIASPFDYLSDLKKGWYDLTPEEKHLHAVEICGHSKEAGVVIPDFIRKYAGTTLNPRFEFLMGQRQQFSSDEQTQANYDRLGKMASAMDLEDVVEALYLIDEEASLTPRYGDKVPDPLLCVYGQEKEAEWSWISGGHYVNEDQLKRFAAAPYCDESLGQVFTPEICEKFKKDSLGTFKGMPLEQQIIVSNFALQAGRKNDGGFWR